MHKNRTAPSAITQRIACKGLILFHGKILILREAKTYKDGTNIGRYCLPGGRIDPGEPYKHGLRREIKEESGLSVTIGSPLFVGEWFPSIRGQRHQIVATFFVCETTNAEVSLSEEHDDYKWIGLDQVGDFDFADPEPDVFAAFRARCGLST